MDDNRLYFITLANKKPEEAGRGRPIHRETRTMLIPAFNSTLFCLMYQSLKDESG